MTQRPWLVLGRSNQYEWNGHEAARFSTEDRADARARQMRDDGYWYVRVYYAPVRKATQP